VPGQRGVTISRARNGGPPEEAGKTLQLQL
jgi:hypothetical protein